MPQISRELLNEIKTDLRRLKRAHTWPEIGLVLFNRDGSYAHKVLHGVFPPSKKALDSYLIWRALNRGRREEASTELCEAVWHYLRPGKEYSTTSREMADYFLIDRRKIRKATADLIDAGFPVGSWQGGYYRIVKPSEKAETERQLLSREREIRRRRINLRKIRLVDRRTKAVMIADGVSQFQLPDSQLIEAP